MAKPAKANERGEVTLTLEGQEYRLRPSYEAIMAIEEATGKTAYELADGARSQSLTIKECGIVAAEMMRAYGRSHEDDPLITAYRGATPEALSRLIYAEGVMRVQPRFYALLVAAVTGGVDAAGELKPATVNPPPAAG